MVRIKDDSGTHTKCLLDPFDEEANQLDNDKDEPKITVTVVSDSETVAVSIADNGPWVPYREG